MQIDVLGPDDSGSAQVIRIIGHALAAHSVSAVVIHSNDFRRMVDFHAFVPPAVMVNGRLRSVGRVPALGEVCDWLETALQEADHHFRRFRDDDGTGEEKT